MNRILLFFLATIPFVCAHAQTKDPVITAEDLKNAATLPRVKNIAGWSHWSWDTDTVYTLVDQMPVYSEVSLPLDRYLQDHLLQSNVDSLEKMGTKVILRFIIEKNGAIFTGFGYNSSLQKEILRMMNELTFSPGTLHGKAVRVQLSLLVFIRNGKDMEKKAKTQRRNSSRVTITSITESVADINHFESKSDTTYTRVDHMPEYPGGESAMLKYIWKNLDTSHIDTTEDIKSKIMVKIVVEKDGSVTAPTMAASSIERELYRIAKALQFIPGSHRGERVRVKMTMPVYIHWQQK